MKTKIILIVSTSVLLSSSALAQKVTSTFTDLDTKLCKTLESDTAQGGSYHGRCAGVAGYSLDVVEDMNRNITIVDPSKKSYQLQIGYYSKLFSDFGQKAEWRMKDKTPIALIFRVKATDQYDYTQSRSYLIISKITKDEVCTTNVINLNKTPNVDVQNLADAAAAKPCRVTQ